MTRLIASWFGSGLLLHRARGSDVGSGTVGGLVALPVAIAIGVWLGWIGQVAAAVVVTLMSLLSTEPWATAEGDPGWVVVDEAAGTFVATMGLGVVPALLAFIVFRVADILKTPFPGVRQAERLPGPYGVTADDLVAGLYGLAVGHVLQLSLL